MFGLSTILPHNATSLVPKFLVGTDCSALTTLLADQLDLSRQQISLVSGNSHQIDQTDPKLLADYNHFLATHRIDKQCRAQEAGRIFVLLDSNGFVDRQFEQDGKLKSLTITMPSTLPDAATPKSKSLLSRATSAVSNKITKWTSGDSVPCATMEEALNAVDKTYTNYRLQMAFKESMASMANSNTPPTLTANQLNIVQGQTVVITSANLNANDPEEGATLLTFTIGGVQGGRFERTSAAGTPITTFTLQEVNNNQIRFVQNGTGNAPSYSVAVSDGTTSTTAAPATITFTTNPLLTANQLSIAQGQSVILTTSNFNATDLTDPSGTGLIRKLAIGLSSVGRAGFGSVISFSPDGENIAFAGAPPMILNTVDWSLVYTSTAQNVFSVVFNPAGDEIALSTGYFKSIHILNATDYSSVRTITAADTTCVNSAIFNPTRDEIATGGCDNSIKIWNVADGNLVRTLSGHTGAVFQVVFNPAGNQIASASDDKSIKIWNAIDGNLIRTLTGHTKPIYSVVFNPKGDKIASSGSDMTGVWNVADGSLIWSSENDPLCAYAMIGGNAVFTPSGDNLIFGSGHVRIYNVADGSLVRTLTDGTTGNNDCLTYVAINPKGDEIVAAVYYASYDGYFTNIWTTHVLSFFVDSVEHGRFERISAAGTAITTFTLGEVQNNNIRFIHDGSSNAPSYRVLVSDGFTNTTTAIASTISFTAFQAPSITTNQITITQGQTITLSSVMLNAIDADTADSDLTFTISGLQHGQFKVSGSTATTFTLAQIKAGAVSFVHDGTATAPSYNITVSDGTTTTTVAAATISFTSLQAPSITTNQITITQGQTITLSSVMLNAIDADTADSDLTFTISGLQHGQFKVSGSTATTFTLAQIKAGAVSFVHDGTATAPSYNITVSDGTTTTTVAAATISFTSLQAPSITTNQITITQGQTITLSSVMLNAIDADTADSDLTFTISNLQHGQFKYYGVTVTNFTLQEVKNGAVTFVHDGTATAPSYSITVSDGTTVTTATEATVNFSLAPTPIPTEAIIGIGIGGTAALVIAGVIIGCAVHKRKKAAIQNSQKPVHPESGTASAKTTELQVLPTISVQPALVTISETIAIPETALPTTVSPYMPSVSAPLTLSGVSSQSAQSTQPENAVSAAHIYCTALPKTKNAVQMPSLPNIPTSMPSTLPTTDLVAVNKQVMAMEHVYCVQPPMLQNNTSLPVASATATISKTKALNDMSGTTEAVNTTQSTYWFNGGYKNFAEVLQALDTDTCVELSLSTIQIRDLSAGQWSSDVRLFNTAELKQILQALCVTKNQALHSLNLTGMDLQGSEKDLAQLTIARPDLSITPKVQDIPRVKTICDSMIVKTTSIQSSSGSANGTFNPAASMSNDPLGSVPIDLNASYVIKFQDLEMGRELGRGAFGIVYRGTWQHTDVAIKQLQMMELSPAVKRSFMSEAQVMTSLHHPNVISFYGVCMEPSHYSMVMEFAQGGSLENLLQNERPLPWSQRWQIALDIGKGLLHLHCHEPPILHRDMKSGNVLLDEHGKAKLTDFGLAKARSETRTMTKAGGVAGSLLWMAPELFSGLNAKPTKAADIFAYAVVLWEIAARKFPYENVSSPNLIPHLVERGEREEIPEGTPTSFAKLISRCWSDRAVDRPTVDEVVRELEAHRGEIAEPSQPAQPHSCILASSPT